MTNKITPIYFSILRVSFSLIMLLLTLLCSREGVEEVAKLEGHWKINYVTANHEYFYPPESNIRLDYYILDSLKGQRRKISLDNGKWSSSQDANFFEVKREEDSIFLYFETRWDKWQEKIIILTDEELVLAHQGKQYHYLRYHLKKSVNE